MSEHLFLPDKLYTIALTVDGAMVNVCARLAGVAMDGNGGPRLLLEPLPGSFIDLWTEAGENLQVAEVHEP